MDNEKYFILVVAFLNEEGKGTDIFSSFFQSWSSWSLSLSLTHTHNLPPTLSVSHILSLFLFLCSSDLLFSNFLSSCFSCSVHLLSFLSFTLFSLSLSPYLSSSLSLFLASVCLCISLSLSLSLSLSDLSFSLSLSLSLISPSLSQAPIHGGDSHNNCVAKACECQIVQA